MCEKVPALRTIRVTKVCLHKNKMYENHGIHFYIIIMLSLKLQINFQLKSFLDFLISEGFTIEDIARRPRVLIASQKTIQQRLEKLRSLGLKEINLNTVSRSRKDFKKYFVSLESVLVQN